MRMFRLDFSIVLTKFSLLSFSGKNAPFISKRRNVSVNRRVTFWWKKTAVHNADKKVFYKKQTNALAQTEQNILNRTLTDTKRMIEIGVLYCIWIVSILYQLNATN